MQITATTFTHAVDRFGWVVACQKAVEALHAAETTAYRASRDGDDQTAAMVKEAAYNLALAMATFAKDNPATVANG